MANPQTRPTGVSPGPTAPPRRPWWLWVLLALVVIALLVFGLVRCGASSGDGSGDGPTASSGAPAAPSAGVAPPAGAPAAPSAGASAAPSAGTSAAPSAGGGGAAAGTLTAGGTALLPVTGAAGPNGELTALVGRPVTAQSVAVQSVPSDEGFWVGTSGTDRVWVELTVPPGESPYQVLAGQAVGFDATVVAHDAGFAGQVGVDAAEGSDQLTRQAAHIAVDKANLRIDQ